MGEGRRRPGGRWLAAGALGGSGATLPASSGPQQLQPLLSESPVISCDFVASDKPPKLTLVQTRK